MGSYGAKGGTGRVCSGERSSRRDLNECSVGGGDVCEVHSGDENTGAIGNGSRRHPRASVAAEELYEVVWLLPMGGEVAARRPW